MIPIHKREVDLQRSRVHAPARHLDLTLEILLKALLKDFCDIELRVFKAGSFSILFPEEVFESASKKPMDVVLVVALIVLVVIFVKVKTLQ